MLLLNYHDSLNNVLHISWIKILSWILIFIGCTYQSFNIIGTLRLKLLFSEHMSYIIILCILLNI